MAQEQLSVEVIAEYLGREAFPAAIADVEKIKKATEGLTKVQRENRRAAEEQAKMVKQQRLATAQLGMQFSQISTQMASGTPVATIFAQQVGDVGYALSNMGGALGFVGRFLAGPFGVALSIAGMGFLALKSGAKEAEEGTVGFTEVAKSTMVEFGNAISSIATQVFEPFGPQIEWLKGKFAELPRFMANVANVVLQTIAGLAVGISKTIANVPNIMKGLIYSAVNGVINTINFFQDVLAGMINTTYSAIKNISAKFGMALPAFEVKFKKFSTKESGLGAIFQDINSSVSEAVTKTYIDPDSIMARAPSMVKKDEDKKKGRDKADKAKDDVQTLADLMDEIQNGSAIFGREFVKDMDKVGLAIEKSGLESLGENITKSIETVKPALEQMQRPIDQVASMAESMGQAFSDGIKGMITGAMSFKQAMSGVIDSVINKLFELFVVQQITGMIGNAISNFTGIPFTPGKAIGGPVQAGKPYMVGERGPEMFVPSRSGSIVPNKNLGGGMTINVDARGASDPAAVRAQVEMGIAQATPYIIAAAQNKTLTTAARPRLPGTIG